MGEELVVHDINWENRLEILKEPVLQLLVPEKKKSWGEIYILTAMGKLTFLGALKENDG